MAARPGASRLLGALCVATRELVSAVPQNAVGGSPRQRESAALRLTHGGGGVRRAKLLDQLCHDMQVATATATLVVEGLADLFAVADTRGGAVNGMAAAVIVRTALEIAGQVDWLLDASIGGDERARRYLVWRFADLGEQRRLLDQFVHLAAEERTRSQAQFDAAEDSLIDLVAKAKWTASRTTARGRKTAYAALLTSDGVVETMPKYGDLVRRVQSTPSTYSLLSTTGHGSRFGMMQGLKTGDLGDESVTGFAVGPEVSLGLGGLAVLTAAADLARWNGLDYAVVKAAALRVLDAARTARA